MSERGTAGHTASTEETRPLGTYAAALASGEPAPGGGSAVAVVGALAAALAQMVCNLTIGRPAYAASEEELRGLAGEAAILRRRLLELAPADESAYRGYLAATRLPRASDTEKAARRAAIEVALVAAADVPLSVMLACRDILALLAPIARHGNRHALTDVAVSLYLADAAARGAALNLRTNARLMKESTRAARSMQRVDAIEGEIRALASAIRDALPFST